VKRSTSEWVAVLLAGGLSFAVVALVLGVTVAAIKNGSTASTLSENETQVLNTAFAAMAGLLGAFIGGRRAGNGHKEPPEEPWPEPQPAKHMALPHWPDRETTAELPPDPPK
jgi:hypothetical protein